MGDDLHTLHVCLHPVSVCWCFCSFVLSPQELNKTIKPFRTFKSLMAIFDFETLSGEKYLLEYSSSVFNLTLHLTCYDCRESLSLEEGGCLE